MKNPFRYGSKVTGGAFYDRVEIQKSILNVIDGCNNVVLYGPRRYGKSSLMYSTERELFEGVFQSLPESQRLVARAIAREPVAKFTDGYRARHLLPSSSTVNTAIRRLVDDSRIDVVDGVYRLVDPLLAHHLRQTARSVEAF